MSARDRLQQVTGLNLTEAIVERAVERRMQALALADALAYQRLLATSAQEMTALTELVVVPESWMFRDAEAFVAATAFIARRLEAGGARPVRILSVPCAGGEEPYSMAMSLRSAGVGGADVAIDAVDLSQVALARARAGLYTRNAFRGRHLDFRERFFTAVGAEYQICDEIRGQVTFNQANLLDPAFSSRPGYYDVIFCRNLLIYFDDPTVAAAIASLSRLLADDGILFAGYAEVPAFCRNGFAALRAPGAFALEKAGAGASWPPRLPARQHARPPPPARPVVHTPALSAGPVARPLRATAPAALKTAAADLLARARRQSDLGDLQGAAAACRELLEHDPDSADAYFILGMVSECEQKMDAAGDYWRRCVYLKPDHYEALCHLALLAEQSGDRVQAAAFKQRAARIYQRANGNERDSAARKDAR
ncbi:methyltransferase domain-containing protein [Massilia sp. CCM 8733]|uniref:Methyltransferase domain-containing protein n=1 Tax=Massilia mucilaginosa TaxID=2609282 RepID=A0ABX0NQN1_9BURK|nr:protein-glutamate O-methyltransferase CheR [Massilia mucilaginosa]NHZ89131.1 methyltransferase domain-containing protein [Massilia mucilaginosa]